MTIKTQAYLQGYLHEKTAADPNWGPEDRSPSILRPRPSKRKHPRDWSVPELYEEHKRRIKEGLRRMEEFKRGSKRGDFDHLGPERRGPHRALTPEALEKLRREQDIQDVMPHFSPGPFSHEDSEYEPVKPM